MKISLFSPGCAYAGLTSKWMYEDQAATCLRNILLGQVDGEPSEDARETAERAAEAFVTYAPSTLTLKDGSRVDVQP